jgi:hypothetical protein
MLKVRGLVGLEYHLGVIGEGISGSKKHLRCVRDWRDLSATSVMYAEEPHRGLCLLSSHEWAEEKLRKDLISLLRNVEAQMSSLERSAEISNVRQITRGSSESR